MARHSWTMQRPRRPKFGGGWVYESGATALTDCNGWNQGRLYVCRREAERVAAGTCLNVARCTSGLSRTGGGR